MNSRRKFLTGILCSSAYLASPNLASSALFFQKSGDIRKIRFQNSNTGERVNTIYWIEGEYEPGEFQVIDGEAQPYTQPYISGTNTDAVREKRNKLLQYTDWTQVPDSPLSNSKKAEWATYRQQLRDMMSSYTDSESNTVQAITWPTPPE
mgnify:CR=1 FL=1